MSLVFKHSGRLGDILYSMPLVKQLAELQDTSADYYVSSDIPARLGKDVFHPSLEVMVNSNLYDYIEPLLSRQIYLNRILHVPTLAIPRDAIDLDQFKTSGLNLKAGLIYGWYRKAFGVPFPLEAPWISVDCSVEDAEIAEDTEISVLVGRTTRFCNTRINYRILDQIKGVGFVGLEYEYEDFIARYSLKNVRHIKVKNALELAILMCRAKIFVGNQSSNFAIAEGLKVTRALEAFEPVPVATPVGGVCFEYINTKFLVSFLSNVLNMQLDVLEDIAGGDYHDSIKPQDGYVLPLKQRVKNLLGIAKKASY